ncbi:MAG: ImmA/IrrE family metallo-endopeptidase [Planctomycetes bacterium]|nr:ImmA/IrrE family metallo-endopeptidase [Planctomycetota bacterium]
MIARPPVWVVALAERFWASASEVPPSFPRDLRESLAWLPHIQVHELPNLTLACAGSFLARLGVPFPIELADRPLRGCFAAHRGTIHILVNASDADAERRFTVAHELAHYLRDYDQPRRRAIARFGPSVLEVFDGERPATFDEQVSGILREVTVNCHSHLLSRDEKGRPESPTIGDTEEAADRLAFELLAPFAAVAAEPVSDRDFLVLLLISKFGLPPRSAAKYAEILLPDDFSRKIWPAFAKI